MTFEEYTISLKELEQEFNINRRNLAKEYATTHNSVKKGDIISDSQGSILVDQINFTTWKKPFCIYWGPMLTKKGEPYKTGQRRCIYQPNLVEGK